MKYCSHCGKEIEDTASHCPYCGNVVEKGLQSNSALSVKQHSISAIILALDSALSIILLFLNWIKVNVFGIVSFTFSPAMVVFKLSDMQEFWGSYMSGDEAYIIPCIIAAVAVFLVLYATTIFCAVKKYTAAMATGFLSHFVMLDLSISCFHYITKASDNSFGMISITPVVYLAIIAACIGIASSVWFFYEKTHSFSATASAVCMMVLIALIPVLFIICGIGAGVVYIAFAQYVILYLFFHSNVSNA